MDKNRNVAGIIIGVILIAIGVLSLFGDFFNFINWDNLWPFAVIGVGAAFFIAMFLGGKTRGGLAVPGSILVTVGLILLVINSTERWEAWAYAWALIICGVGFGVLINGIWSDRPELRKQGWDTIRSGFVLFLIFGVIMQFVFSVTGVAQWGSITFWAALLVLMGLYLLITRLLRLGKADGESTDLFWPVLMIGVGIIAILADRGWLPEENLLMLLNLWPLLLIVAGLGLLFRGRNWVGALLGVSVVAVIFITVFAGEGLGLKAAPFGLINSDLFENIGTSGERITGSGNVVTENRPVSGFDQVQLAIPANLEIQQGTTEGLTVSIEDNLLPYLVTNVSGSELTIRFKSGANIHPTKPIQIALTVKNLKGLDLSSSGKVMVGPLTTGDFRLKLSSSGNIDIEQIQADQVTAELSSSGDIVIKGTANKLDLRVTSSGSFDASDLQVQEATVKLSSSGEVTVWVVEDLQVNISSSGNVAYYGSPTVHSSLSSSGEVIPKGDK